jgi:broad specificity phosphatase PhoE
MPAACCSDVVPRLWLVRHGETDWNRRGLVQGQRPGPVLTSRGVDQARWASFRLRERRVGALFSSDLPRAVQTAEILGNVLRTEVRLDAALRERNLGDAEGLPSSRLGPDSGVVDGRVVDADRSPHGGESLRQLYERVVAFTDDALRRHPADDLVFVAHGGVIRVLIGWFAGLGPDEMHWGAVGNGAVVEFRSPAAFRTPAAHGTAERGWGEREVAR